MNIVTLIAESKSLHVSSDQIIPGQIIHFNRKLIYFCSKPTSNIHLLLGQMQVTAMEIFFPKKIVKEPILEPIPKPKLIVSNQSTQQFTGFSCLSLTLISLSFILSVFGNHQAQSFCACFKQVLVQAVLWLSLSQGKTIPTFQMDLIQCISIYPARQESLIMFMINFQRQCVRGTSLTSWVVFVPSCLILCYLLTQLLRTA